MIHCKECKHWFNVEPAESWCSKLSDTDGSETLAHAEGEGPYPFTGWFVTKAEFGCVEGEKNEDICP
jgi:hypothetical protein